MAELVKEQVHLDRLIGSENVQIMLEGDLIVPDTKPDIAFLLQTDEGMTISHTEVGTDRVNFVGQLDISVLYLAKDTGKSAQCIQLNRAVDDFVNFEGAHKDIWVRVKANIVNIDYRLVNDRKVNYRAVVNLSIQGESSDACEMVVHINDVPENQLLKRQLTVNRTAGHHIDRLQIKDQITLPTAKPNLREMLQTAVHITGREVRVGSGRVNISGELQITALYRGDTEDSLIEFIESEIPFSGAIDLAGAGEDMLSDTALQILDKQVTIRPDDDGEDRVLDVEVTVGADIKVYSAETREVLEDAYAINQRLDFEKTVVRYPRLVCLNRNQAPVKDVVSVEGNAPDMLQIFRVKGQAHIDDVRVIDDKIIVEGAIHTDILYVAESDAMPLAGYRTVIPYRQVIEAKGAAAGMHVNVDASIDHAAFNMLSPRETEVRFQLTFNTHVVCQEEGAIINHVEIGDMDPDELSAQPSMTVYIVQNGDNLWKVAKKYNMSIDELTNVNELENPPKIAPGQKLLMLKKGM